MMRRLTGGYTRLRRRYGVAGHRLIRRRHPQGLDLSDAKQDGTVSNVETLPSIGHPYATRDCINAFSKWRFRPDSVTTLRIPAYYTRAH